ncbi:MAG: FRG domain-containing protein [Erysipelotrichaceae bacterium]|nr:FRG domain-containing protein [Erysipelotrichaceae bacterium]
MKTVTIHTLDEIAELFFEQVYYEKEERFRSPFLYRGMPNAKFKLMTSLERNCKEKKKELEKPILRNFAKYAISEDPQLSGNVWRQMIVGQHHGLPTRLLDWTISPLTALHFATSGEDVSKMDKHDCVIWKIDYKELNSLLPEIYQNMLKRENANLMTVGMLQKLVNCIEDYDRDMKNQSMLLVEPPSLESRIANQYSYFSIIPDEMEDIEQFLKTRTKNTVRYIIDKDIRWRIRDMLDQMNVNERILSPGLDGVSQWIRRHYFVKSKEE